MYDLGLLGGLIVDGKRTEPYRANLYIKDGKIACITDQMLAATEILDVSGLTVAPGFIDIHSHSDSIPFRARTPQAKIRQGVTTEVIGNCGTSIFPGLESRKEECEAFNRAKRNHPGFMSVTEYSKAVNSIGHVCNCAPLLGHSNLRIAVMGHVNRAPSDKEMAALKDLLDREMARGAFGMSLGLIYPPSAFSAKEELIELAKVIAKHGGILAVHMRNEGPRLFEAVDEMIEIAERSGVHIQVSHLKLMGTPQWGKAPKLIEKIDAARRRGLNITCDQYPFTASSTSMSAMVPHWAHEGGADFMCKRLEAREGDICESIGAEMANRGGPDAVLVISVRDNPQYAGKYVSEIAEMLDLSPVEAVRRMLLEGGGSASCIYFSMDQQDVEYIMKQTYICVGSDGSAYDYDHPTNLHPRNFAAFSQYFQTVREKGILPLQDMVYKASELTASILGITDRGTLEEGKWADIAVFDSDAYSSRSTFLAPMTPPAGMYHVLVNGQFAVRNNALTGIAAGKGIVKE